jgi:hypothetical protein
LTPYRRHAASPYGPQGIRPCSGKTAFLVARMAWSTGSPGL